MIRFITDLEMDQDGETILGIVTEPDTKDIICIHTGHTIDEVREEIIEYLSELFWDFDDELHLKEGVN